MIWFLSGENRIDTSSYPIKPAGVERIVDRNEGERRAVGDSVR